MPLTYHSKEPLGSNLFSFTHITISSKDFRLKIDLFNLHRQAGSTIEGQNPPWFGITHCGLRPQALVFFPDFVKVYHVVDHDNVHFGFLSSFNANHTKLLTRRKIERGPLRTCRVHRRHLHRSYPIFLPYPRAMLCALSFSVLELREISLPKLLDAIHNIVVTT